MDSSADLSAHAIRAVTDFSIRVSPNPARAPNALMQGERRVTTLTARLIEAQYRLADGKTLILASDDEPFEESLTILLIGPDLRVLDQEELGGAYTPGFMAYVAPFSDNEVVFCWHDHEQVVTVRRYRPWHRIRPRWLSLRDLLPQRDPALRVHRPKR